MLGHDRLGPRAEHHLEPEVGEALGEQALRGADQEDRLLEPVAAPDQAHLLAAVLGVVPGIGLVRDEVGERRRQHRQVGVDRHPRAQPAEVVVETRPRLVGDELELDVLALGQPEEPLGPLAQVLGQRIDGRRADGRAGRRATRARRSGGRRAVPSPGSASSSRRWAAANSSSGTGWGRTP